MIKNCDTCKHEYLNKQCIPCCDCTAWPKYECWEPKEMDQRFCLKHNCTMKLEQGGVWVCPKCYDEGLTESKEEEVKSDVKEVGLKYDEGKLRFDLILPEWEEEDAKAMTYGASKYADNSWQNVENFKNRYYAALRRHLNAYRRGEKVDPESGLHHLTHAKANINFLLWKELQEEKIQGCTFIGAAYLKDE